MDCFHQTLVQVRIWVFFRRTMIKMADKMAIAYQFASIRCYGHSNLVICKWISSKFHIWFASIKPWFKFEYEFCPKRITKMANIMAATYQFASIGCCGHSNLVIFNQISSKFHIRIASIKLWFKFKYGCFSRITIIKMADKMAVAYQFASIRCFGHSNIVICNLISSKFHIWFASIKPWFKFEYEFCPKRITKMADIMAPTYQFASIGCCGHSNLVIFNRISSKFHIWFASIKPWFKFEYEFCRTNYNQDV